MGRMIAVANQKGGVGKTTTAINLAASMASSRRRLLLVDLDPQGNATMGSGVEKNSLERSAYDVMMGECQPGDALITLPRFHYDLLPGNGDLTAAEVKLMEKLAREQRLKRALAPIREHYDYIIVDCPPSLNILTLNALVAADGVLIPMQCEYYALEGLSALLTTIQDVRDSVNPELEIDGLLRTMYDGRNNLGSDVSRQLAEHFGDQVYRTIIPRNVRLAEAPSHGRPVLYYDRTSRGALAYLALAGEVLRKDTRQQQSEGAGVA